MAEIEESKITDITGGSELDKMDARAKAAVVVVSLGADRVPRFINISVNRRLKT